MSNERKKLADVLGYHSIDVHPDDFRQLVADTFREMFCCTVETLLCEPRDAVRFCDAIIAKLEAPSLPDSVILGTLLNMRKVVGGSEGLATKKKKRHTAKSV